MISSTFSNLFASVKYFKSEYAGKYKHIFCYWKIFEL